MSADVVFFEEGAQPAGTVRVARVPGPRLAMDAGALRQRGLTHVLFELHGPHADAHATCSRSLFASSSAPIEGFDTILAAIGHARAHGLAAVVVTDASRSGARVLRETGALMARLGVSAWLLHGPWTAPELAPPQLPRIALTMPFVLDAALRAQKAGIEVALLGMPLCLLGPHHGLAIASVHAADGEPCVRCAARASCSGIGPTYRATYGATELRPLPAPVATHPSALGAFVLRALAG